MEKEAIGMGNVQGREKEGRGTRLIGR